MLKRLLLPATLLLALLAPGAAFADYVCQTQYYPNPARIKLVTTTSSNCTGTTTTWWACESTSSSTSCGTQRYTVDELIGLQSSLVSAADTQQVVFVTSTNCTNSSAVTCLYSVNFRQ